jgi:hypothetical protein
MDAAHRLAQRGSVEHVASNDLSGRGDTRSQELRPAGETAEAMIILLERVQETAADVPAGAGKQDDPPFTVVGHVPARAVE